MKYNVNSQYILKAVAVVFTKMHNIMCQLCVLL